MDDGSRSVLAALCGVALLTFIATQVGRNKDETPVPAVTSSPAATPSVASTRYPDCGDKERPCVTFDDGARGDGWYLVTTDSATRLQVPPVPSVDTAGVTWYTVTR